MTPSTEALVCIVDDDHDVRTALVTLLRLEGFRCEVFESACALLSILPSDVSAAPPTCVVCDVRMPGVDGLQFLARASADSHISVVLMSGQSGVQEAAQAFRLGAVDFLVKPTGADTLIDAVTRALARSAERLAHGARARRLRERIATLTPRERQVARLLAEGASNPQVALALGIAVRTVKVHRQRVMEKLGAATLPDFVRMADAGAL